MTIVFHKKALPEKCLMTDLLWSIYFSVFRSEIVMRPAIPRLSIHLFSFSLKKHYLFREGKVDLHLILKD